ncbi:MAG: hypothetical protein AB7S44_03580 [Spirochaetales bacterium]
MENKVKHILRGVTYGFLAASIGFAGLKGVQKIRDVNLDKIEEQGYTNTQYNDAVAEIVSTGKEQAHSEMEAQGYDFYWKTDEILSYQIINKIPHPIYKVGHWHIRTDEGLIDEHDSEYDGLVEEYRAKVDEYTSFDVEELKETLRANFDYTDEFVTNYDKDTKIISVVAAAGVAVLVGTGGVYLETNLRDNERWATKQEEEEKIARAKGLDEDPFYDLDNR